MPGLALGGVTQGEGTVLSDQEEGVLPQDRKPYLPDSWPPL